MTSRARAGLVAAVVAGLAGCGGDEVVVDGGTSLDANVGDAGTVDGGPRIIGPIADCDLPNVRTFDTLATSDADGPLIRLRYRVFPSARADAPVVIVVPGGPGQALMADDAARDFALGGVPLDAFTVIYVDARGSGCNELPFLAELADEDVYSIDRVAEDLVALVRAEGLEDYYLFGASFGTTAVTVAAHLLEQRGLALPHRVVLEGVVGRSFASFDEYFAAFESEWLRVEPMLPQEWRDQLGAEPFPEPHGWSREQWGAFVAQQLILGDYPGQGHLLDYWLRGLSTGDAAAESYVSRLMDEIPAEGTVSDPGPLFRTIACRELWGGWRSFRELRDGELRAIGEDVCRSEPRVPYDAAEFPSDVPFVYFHGPFDPTTTTAQAEHHFASGSGPAQLVVVPEAAHAPLTLGLAARGCATDVWAAIAADDDLTVVLDACERAGETIELRTRE